MAKSTAVVDLDVTELERVRGPQGVARRRNLQTFSATGNDTVDRYITEIEFDVAGNSTVTIPHAGYHPGLLVIKAIVEPTGSGHTVTLTTGEFNATGHNVATFADIDDCLVVSFDSYGNGTIVENVGSVGTA